MNEPISGLGQPGLRSLARCLPRQRLLAPLLDPAGPRLVVVSAPAGSGKTTLLRQAAQLSSTPAVHVQITSDDCTGPELVKRVREATACLSGPVTESRLLLIDDLHEIASTDAEPALAQLVRDWLPRWRVVLGCRRAPLPDLPSLRLSADVLEITGDDLRFRSWEVEELFDAVLGHPLAPETAAALTRRIGGWAAGLTLFHLATLRHTAAQRRRSVDELGSGSRLLRYYLTRTVLADLPARRRRFLTLTCALGALTGPLCDALLDTTGSLALLEELVDEQLFTSWSGDGRTFRYHHVLQSHLEVALLDELGAGGARDWYARCADLLEGAGLIQDALRAYARAEDWASLRRLLHHREASGPGQAWQELLPVSLRVRDPWFIAADARRHLREGDLAAAASGLRTAALLSDEPSFHERCRQQRLLIEAWSQGRRAASFDTREPGPCHWSDRILAATRLDPDRFAVHPPLDHSPAAHLATGVAHLLAGRVGAAATHFAAGAECDGDGIVIELGLELGGLVTELLDGTRPSPDRLEATLLRAETEDQPWFARLARAIAATGADYRDRPAAHARLLAECERHGDGWGAALITLLAGASGLFDSSDSSDDGDLGRLDEACHRFTALDAPVLAVWCRAAAALALHRRGSGEAAEALRATELAARRARVPAVAALVRAAATATRAPAVPVLTLSLTCLGGFRLTSGPRAVDLTEVRPRARALLRYLTLHMGADVHRERLIDDLWPAAMLAAGIRSLHVAVSSIRRALDTAGLDGGAVLARRADAYRLELPAGSTFDLAQFQGAAAAAQAARATGDLAAAAACGSAALALYVGELLPEDGPSEWVVEERERLRLLAAVTAANLARDLAALGRLAEAVTAARQAVQIDPWSDLAWRLLAETHERVGDHGAALRVRRQQASAFGELLADSRETCS